MTSQCKTKQADTASAAATANKPICNICRQEYKPDNLLTPCNCKGVFSFVHFDCLKLWIETSSTDVCAVCKRRFSNGLVIRKRAGRFGKFFYHSEMGRLYSQFTYFFLVMLYLSYLGSFHCRLSYLRGFIAWAIVIAIFNAFYLIIHTALLTVYFIMVYVSFLHWRKNHFDMEVNRA